jgi:putative endonuclease
MENDWSVYMLRCADNTLYTGVTNNIDKRVHAHNTAPTGAKYTKARRPVVLVYQEDSFTRGEALKREAVLRKLPRQTKLLLLKVLDK